MTELEQKALLDSVKNQVKEQLEAAQKGLVTVEALKSIEDAIAKLSAENPDVKKLTDEVATLTKAMADQNVELKKLKEEGLKNEDNESIEKKFSKDLSNFMDSEEYKAWSASPKGVGPELKLKYSLSSGSTGTVMTTSISPIVSDSFVPRKLHLRNIMSVIPTDMSEHTFDRVTAWVPGCGVISENGDANTFDITTAEQTVHTKRISGIMDISNRVLRSKAYLTRHILARAPEKLYNVEDAEILFGDGSGDHVDGIYKNATTFDLTGPTFNAGRIDSVATYNGGTQALITFDSAHNLTNSYNITIANATAPRYNATFPVIVLSATTIVVTPAGGFLAEANTDAWTATSKHALYHSIELANELNCIRAAKTFMEGSEYMGTGVLLNPTALNVIRETKDTTGRPVYDLKVINGVTYIDDMPVINTNSISSDVFVVGDFVNAIELLQYQTTTLQFVQDVSYVKKNKQALYVSEEILLPIYNPFMFVKGSFADVKTALEKP